MKRVGIIVRANEKGLGTQTRNAWQNYPFDSTLLVLDGNRRALEHPEWYPGAHTARYDPILHEFTAESRPAVEAFLDEIDVLFSVETPYDWSLGAERSGWKRTLRVIQGNPEFYTHETKPDRAQPDRWTWPTTWRTDKLPPGPVVPVPAPTDCWAKPASLDEPMTIVHVAGHRANADRNGTDPFMDSLRYLAGPPVRARVYGQDGQLPELPRLPANVEVEMKPNGVLDRWEMYDDAHILVMPRRYGGLCLPVQEALTAGLAVVMTDCPPNPQTWPIKPLSHGRGRLIRTPGGNIPTHVVSARSIGQALMRYERHPGTLPKQMEQSLQWAEDHSWEVLKPMYDELFQSW